MTDNTPETMPLDEPMNANANANDSSTEPNAAPKAVVRQLSEGDVIRVPQYKNALKVNHLGELNGEPNSFIGLEFVQNPTSAGKHMVVNQHSGRVYLVAGTTDKGEVKTIEVVTEVED